MKWVCFALLCLLVLCTGDMPLTDILSHLKARMAGKTTSWNALIDERLPRLIVLLTSGASLAVAGAVMQSLFCNPLASPSILALSFGGSLAAFAVLLSGFHESIPALLPASACVGCLATLSILRWTSDGSNHGLILSGIALSTLFLTIQKSLAFALRDHWTLMQAITEWETGSSFDRSWEHVHLQLPLALFGLYTCFRYREELNILSLGVDEALVLGVDVEMVRGRLFFAVAALTGGTLASLGLIGFYGLVIPHLVRTLFGPEHKALIPRVALTGAAVLTSLDLVIRILDLAFLSLGTVSALVGAVLFVTLLTSRARHAFS